MISSAMSSLSQLRFQEEKVRIATEEVVVAKLAVDAGLADILAKVPKTLIFFMEFVV